MTDNIKEYLKISVSAGDEVSKWLQGAGREFGLPPKMAEPRGTIKECFRNAAIFAMQDPDRYIYVEGLSHYIIPVEHAWCYDVQENRIIETTWELPGTEYFGVPFKYKYLMRILHESMFYGIVRNRHNGFALVRGETPAREYLYKIPKSKTRNTEYQTLSDNAL